LLKQKDALKKGSKIEKYIDKREKRRETGER